MTTYTVLHDGDVLGRGLTAAEAAAEILTYDGREYEVRPQYLTCGQVFDSAADAEAYYADQAASMAEGGMPIAPEAAGILRPRPSGFWLWSRQQVVGRDWTRTVVYSAADTREEAEAEIFGRVIEAGWARHPEAMTDADYDAMMADLEEDQESA